jgi:hypothetical protein
MASTYTTSFRLELQITGENSSTWGTKTNTNWSLMEVAVNGWESLAYASDANKTLTTANAAADEARYAMIVLTGTISVQRDLIVPLVSKKYKIKNSTTGGFAVRVIGASGTGIVIPNGYTMDVYCDGTNVLAGANYLSSLMVGTLNTSRVTVASHATTADIWSVAGTQIDWTGTATTTAFPTATQAGISRTLICADAPSFTAGANMLIAGVTSGDTVTLAANDIVEVLAITTTQFLLTIMAYNAPNDSRVTVASHATTADIWGARGKQINWTGTATTTAFPNAPRAGAERVLICADACSFTAGANMLIDGVSSGSTVTCATNDQVIVRAVSTTQFKLSRVKYDGTAQVSSIPAFPTAIVSELAYIFHGGL